MGKRIVIQALGVGLVATSWLMLGVLMAGDRYLERIPRSKSE